MEYYKKVEIKEHMLYASEIAELFGILSRTNKPAIKFISQLLKEEIINKKEEQLYYNAKDGLRKVYPKSIYIDAMKKLNERLKHIKKDKQGFYYIKLNNEKNYYIKISEKRFIYL